MMSDKLPSVLTDKINSISMERALKQIKELIENIEVKEGDDRLHDTINASIDDIELMLSKIE
jgi:hypothetical protein